MAKDVNKSLNDTFEGIKKPLPVSQLAVAGVAVKQVLTAASESATQIYSEALPSVLLIIAREDDGDAQGSAVAIADDIAITNCHVVMPDITEQQSLAAQRFDADIFVLTSNGRKARAAVIEHHEDIDTCFLRVSGLKLSPIKAIRSFGWLKIGEPVYALGSPKGLAFTFSQGILSQLRPDFVYPPTGAYIDAIQFSAPISGGSSGGALLDGGGNLIGVTSGELKGGQALNFAIAADLAWRRFGK